MAKMAMVCNALVTLFPISTVSDIVMLDGELLVVTFSLHS